MTRQRLVLKPQTRQPGSARSISGLDSSKKLNVVGEQT